MSRSGGVPPTKAQLFDEVRAAMKAEFGLNVEALRPTTHLVDDLDLDSIDLVDFAASLEESLDLSFREEELVSVRRIQDVVELVHAALVARHAASG